MTPRSDSDRIENLARDVAPDLLRYFERRALPIDDAADLVSETLLVVFRRADAVPLGGEESRMWAFGVARKMLAGHRRGFCAGRPWPNGSARRSLPGSIRTTTLSRLLNANR